MFEIFTDLLHEVNKAMEEIMRKVFIEYNFSISTMLIIGQVKKEPGIIISEIARRTGIAKLHISKTIENLQQKGWVEKRPDSSDSRILRIFLTEIAIEQMKQITNQIKKLIIKDELAEGEAVPSIRNLAKELQISVITTKRAYEELENEGYIVKVAGKGSYVAPQHEELIKEKRLKIVEEKLLEAIKTAKPIHLDLEELEEMLRILFKEE
ncbi:MAG: GntR family transcriptional regulator [Halanaerobiales bacterium]|nr:GntR family transcriptional regulator [Halanaerobiales bacterium]